MRRRNLRFAVAASLAMTLVAPLSVRAAEPDAAELQLARSLFARGEKAERAGQWADAIESLREVARIKSTPGVVFHIANCEEHLEQLAEALADFRLAQQLAEDRSAADVTLLVAPRLAALDKRVPRLVVEVDPPDAAAELFIDGAALPRGAWNTQARLNPGERHVVARIGARDVVSTRITLAEGASTRVHVDLRAELAAPPPVPPPAAPVRAATSSVPPRRSIARPPSPPDAVGPPTSTLLLGGAALLLAGGGVAALVTAGAKNDAGRDACSTPETCDPSARGAVRALDGLALGLWVGSGLAAATGVVLWTTAKPSRAARAQASLVVGPTRLGFQTEF